MHDSMKESKESSSRLCSLGDVSLPAARWGVSGVVSWASDFAWVSSGPLAAPIWCAYVGVMRRVRQGGGARAICGLCFMG